MKKVLLTLIMSVVFGGTIFAQYYPTSGYYNPNDYATYFNTAYEFHPGNYMYTDYPIAYLQRNGALITLDDNWADYEVASFVDGELRGFCFMSAQYSSQFEDWGYEIPMFDGIFVFNAGDGEVVTFKVYDHSTGIEYECTTNMEVITGGDYSGVYDDPEGTSPESLIISFTADEPQGETFTLDINGYEEPEGNDNYYLIASPVGDISAGAVGSLVSNSFDFYSFNQSAASEEWVNLVGTAEEYEMQIGVGYLYANSDTVTLVFTGTPIDPEEYEDYPIVLDFDTDCTTEWQGYNLIGNPYGEPAFLDRPYLRLVDGEYQVVDEPDYGEVAVEAMEGVFVQAENADDDVATFSLMAGGSGFGEGKKCVLNVTQGRGLVDRAVIRFGEGHQMTKVQFNSSHSKLYIPQDGKDYAVVRSAEMGEMPVNFKAGESGSYMLSVDPKNVEFNYLHLIDNMTGADVDLLASPSYSFEANTSDYASRFKLVFATGSNSDDSFAFFSNGSFVISNEGEATLQVVDVMGRILKSETISGSANVNVNAAPGVYMLRLINGDNMKVQKVIVK